MRKLVRSQSQPCANGALPVLTDGQHSAEERTFTGSALIRALAEAPAGQSDVLSCLLWAFENYGRLAPPKDGFTAYVDPELVTGEALMALARAAAEFFGYELPA